MVSDSWESEEDRVRLESTGCAGVREGTGGLGGSGRRGTVGVFLCVNRRQWETVNIVCNERSKSKDISLALVYGSAMSLDTHGCCSGGLQIEKFYIARHMYKYRDVGMGGEGHRGQGPP